jgi:cytoskeletal protein CcmA (bactofilin family)
MEGDMFGKGTEASGGDRHVHSILQDGMVVQGTLEAKGDVRLDGRLEGKIRVTERLTVGTSGVLSADVEAGEAIIMGTVEGTIKAHRRLELRKGARVIGDISSPILMIEEGVHFHGNCNMLPSGASVDSLGLESIAAPGRERTSEEKKYEQLYQ